MELVSNDVKEQRFNSMIESIENSFVLANFTKRLRIFKNTMFEVKFQMQGGEYVWMKCKVLDDNTGEYYTFKEDSDDEDEEGQQSTVVDVEIEDGEKRKICFLSDRFIYSLECEYINLWRHVGSDFDMTAEEMDREINGESGDEEDDEYQDGEEDEEDEVETIDLKFSSKKELERKINLITCDLFNKILGQLQYKIKAMDYITRRNFETSVLMFKEEMCKSIIEFTMSRIGESGNSISITLEDMKEMVENVLQTIDTRIQREHVELMRNCMY